MTSGPRDRLATVASERAPRAIGPYAQAIRYGELIFCSGQVALDPRSGELVGGGIRAETKQALANLAAVLEAAGSDLAHVTKTTVYLTDLGDFKDMNEVYGDSFGGHTPARATVQVAGLPRGARVEIECVAIRAA
ncbi:MAG TPA: RidA family protein [Candidatus Dormibacteraeota bacterium]|jgi:2-iminobutanoate/2-iminopropanoate deaminase|nr:RidA family protein [Candidatus Dormibacteraeota bacterium]